MATSIAVSLSRAALQIALTDAAFDQSQVLVHQFNRPPPGGWTEPNAYIAMPTSELRSSTLFPLTRREETFLNNAENAGKFRLLIFTASDEAITFAYVRHELEHARQYRSNPMVLLLGNVVLEAMTNTIPLLPGSGRIYNLLPTETDANAASARALEAHYSGQVQQITSGVHAALTRETGAPEPETIFFRTFCFASLFGEAVRQVFTGHGILLTDFLSNRDPDFVVAWDDLLGDLTLVKELAAVSSTFPSPAEISAAQPLPGNAWDAAANAYKAAYVRALHIMEFPA